MATQEHTMIPVTVLHRFVTDGIRHISPLPLDHTAGDRGMAQARIASWIQKEAGRYGIVVRSDEISFELETEDVGIFGFADPLRKTWVEGVWTMDLGPAPGYSLRYGPAHGLTGRLTEYDGKPTSTITVVGQRAAFATFGRGDQQTLTTSEGVYVLAGWDPLLSALVYDHDKSVR